MITVIEENYIKEILLLGRDTNKVSLNQLSIALNVKMPTANSMMKRLAGKGLVHYESYKPIRLTPEGEKMASIVLRKHRLTESFLTDVMKLEWDQVHEIAEQIEHIQSELFFDKMDEILNFPKTDPHGEPIPSRSGEFIKDKTLIKLSSCKEGDIVIFKSVDDSTKEFLHYLNNKELHLELELKVKRTEAFDESITIVYNSGQEASLSKLVAEKMLVQIVS